MNKIAPIDDIASKPNQASQLKIFKAYVENKCCFYAPALDNARVEVVQEKIAYQCQMAVLIEERTLRTDQKPYRWQGQGKTLLGSHTLGLIFCENPNNRPPIGNIWTDYNFKVPEEDERSLSHPIIEGRYYTRCYSCSGRGQKSCQYCNGSGRNANEYVIS